jgi:hypothetical protein
LVRVLVRWSDVDRAPSTTVIVRAPGTMPGGPWRLQSVPYQRSVAHIKHLGDFGQSYYGRSAERNGYDEALLTGPDGTISEGSITNIGFFAEAWSCGRRRRCWRHHDVAVPAETPDHGIESRRRTVRLADVTSFAAFAPTRGIAAVRQIDDHVFHWTPG